MKTKESVVSSMRVKLLGLAYLAWMGDARMGESAMVRKLGCDGWCIGHHNISDVAFDNTTTNEFHLSYNVSNTISATQLKTSVMHYNCSSEVSGVDELIDSTISNTTMSLGVGFNEMSVLFDIKKDKIQGSDLWRDIDNSTGEIEFCVKTELMSGNLSVSFHETQMSVTVNMTAGFEMEAQVEGIDASIVEKEATANYTLNGCICEPSTCACKESKISQNEKFDLCIKPTSTEVRVKEVFSLTLYQEGIDKHLPIANGKPDGLTTRKYDGSCAVVSTRAVSRLFNSPSDVTAQGTAYLEFSTSGRRELRGLAVQGQGEVSGFDVKIGLEVPSVSDPNGANNDNGSNMETVTEAPKAHVVGLLFILAGLCFVLFSIIVVWRRRYSSK